MAKKKAEAERPVDPTPLTPKRDPVAERHAKRRRLFGMPEREVTQQEALNAVTAQLTALVMQLVWGHHNPTRMQLLLALSAIEQALPHCKPDHNLPVVPQAQWVHEQRKRVDPLGK